MNKLIWLTALAIGCGGKLQTVDEDDGEGDEGPSDCSGPEIEHEPIELTQPMHIDVQINASVLGEEGCDVLAVVLYYTQETSLEWKSSSMAINPSTGEYRGTIPGLDVSSGSMRYYLYAVDTNNNETVEPEDADEDFLKAWDFGVSVN